MSAYQNDIKAVAALKETFGSSWSAINPESVARMRAQNRFKTGLEIAQYTADIALDEAHRAHHAMLVAQDEELFLAALIQRIDELVLGIHPFLHGVVRFRFDLDLFGLLRGSGRYRQTKRGHGKHEGFFHRYVPLIDLDYYLSPALRQKKDAGYFYPAARGQFVHRPMMCGGER